MHQNSDFVMLSETRVRKVRPLRFQRKLSDGGGLYLLVAPNGGRYWRYNADGVVQGKTECLQPKTLSPSGTKTVSGRLDSKVSDR
jgi:hypothetical protein